MYVSELIERLTNLQEQNGELQVRVDSDDYCLDIHRIDNLRCDEHKGDWYIDIIIK